MFHVMWEHGRRVLQNVVAFVNCQSGIDTFDRTGIRLQPQLSNVRFIKHFGMEPARRSFGNPVAFKDYGTGLSYRLAPRFRELHVHIEVRGVTRWVEQLFCSQVLPFS